MEPPVVHPQASLGIDRKAVVACSVSDVCFGRFVGTLESRKVPTRLRVNPPADLLDAVGDITTEFHLGKVHRINSAEKKLTRMTSTPPERMNNGGLSIRSCPTLMMTSATSTDRCTKFLVERAALPRTRGWFSSRTPFPFESSRRGCHWVRPDGSTCATSAVAWHPLRRSTMDALPLRFARRPHGSISIRPPGGERD